MGIAGFSPLSLSKGQESCRGRLKVHRWRVGDRDKGLGTGLPGLGDAALSGRGPSSQTTDCAGSLAPTPEFSVQPARAAPSHPPGTARHLPAPLGSRAPGPATSAVPAPAAAPAPPAAAWRPQPTPLARWLARGRGPSAPQLSGAGDPARDAQV